nr:alpha-mannosidase I MNS5-like isoform X3 [Malus domestica]XP_028959818.1 alpha-mannosidase I MNS5-like isoform X3 [Malus domestica]XP_028959819.1 alpha-mannosidase I MNS5-like isoform X3 [Malus domestica]XP_028959820.1 alpha-mannosidase I MNS5-like isoform X3 [Malus domestica]XP_028959821.1 alpha-mannosidase I MNS5-like isoform X3 [Malus domestica]XP_028959822.1 alpha-mannosidase I MNS5-like isoform X3 [Malus domestica]
MHGLTYSVDGVMEKETTEISTSGCGALSRLTGDPKYESAALCALCELWGTWSSLNLLGTMLDVSTGEWIVYSSGIGAGDDYLFKGHILVGNEFWRMFHSAVQKYFRHGPWKSNVLAAYKPSGILDHQRCIPQKSIILCALNWRNQLSTCIKQLNV